MSSGAGTSFEVHRNWWGKTKQIWYDPETMKVLHTSHGFPGYTKDHTLDTKQIKFLQSRGYKFIQTKGETK